MFQIPLNQLSEVIRAESKPWFEIVNSAEVFLLGNKIER